MIFSGGYTAGHILPGLAVIAWLRTRRPEIDCAFFGSSNGWERKLVEAAGVPFHGLPAVPWAGQPWRTRGLALVRLMPAVFAARRKMRALGAVGCVGLGSCATVAPALAMRSLGCPVTLYEPNATMGLATRLLRPMAARVLASRLLDRSAGVAGATIEVGVPLAADRLALAAQSPEAPGREPGSEVRLLVLGGSLGNSFLNRAMPGLARRLRVAHPGLRVVHQCGHAVAPGPLAADYAAAGVPAEVVPYFDLLGPRLRTAQLVVTAAGAISLHEVAAAGVPALVVPLEEGAGAHQLANASAFSRITGGRHVRPGAWHEAEIAAALSGLMADPARWREARAGLGALVNARADELFGTAIAPAGEVGGRR